MLEVVPEAFYIILILGFFFSLFCSDWVLSASLPSKSLILSSASSTPPLISYKSPFTSVSVSLISDELFFMVSMPIFMLWKF